MTLCYEIKLQLFIPQKYLKIYEQIEINTHILDHLHLLF